MGLVPQRAKNVIKRTVFYKPLCILHHRAIRLNVFLQKKKMTVSSAASINPLKLYRVDPLEISHAPKRDFKNRRFRFLSPVLKGDWDLNRTSLRTDYAYRSVHDHFKNDIPWEKTDLYKRTKDELTSEKNHSRWGCNNFQEFQSRLSNIDELFRVITNSGYKTQRELQTSEDDPIGTRSCHPPEWNEVTVHVSRNGEFLFHEGRHRLAIAQALEIDKIPVRIMIRHHKWQLKRTNAFQQNKIKKHDSNHPDINNLIS